MKLYDRTREVDTFCLNCVIIHHSRTKPNCPSDDHSYLHMMYTYTSYEWLATVVHVCSS